jgi:putative glutamine amidotransferase
LRCTAFAPDTLVEGLEMNDYPFGVAVQWHPEAMPENAQMQALFKAFIEAASK